MYNTERRTPMKKEMRKREVNEERNGDTKIGKQNEEVQKEMSKVRKEIRRKKEENEGENTKKENN